LFGSREIRNHIGSELLALRQSSHRAANKIRSFSNRADAGDYWRADVSAIHGRVRVAQVVDLDAGFILMK
jgi:hypothetical protein